MKAANGFAFWHSNIPVRLTPGVEMEMCTNAEPVRAGNGGIAGSWVVGSVLMLWSCRAAPDLYR